MYEVLPFPNADKAKKLVSEAEQFFQASEEAKKPREDLYRRAYKLFRAYLKKTKEWKFSTLILDPVLWSALTTKSARMKKAIFSTFPVVRYRAEGASGTGEDERARAFTQMFGYYQNKDRPRVKLGCFLDALALAGNGFVHWHWLYEESEVCCEEEREVTERIQVTDDLGNPMVGEDGEFLEEEVSLGEMLVKTKRKVAIVDRPTWDSIHFTEAFPDSTAIGIHDGSYFIRRTFRRKSYCLKMARLAPEDGGWNKKAVTRALKAGCSVPIEEIRKNLQWQAEVGHGSVQTLQDVGDDPFVEVWDVYRQGKLLCYTVLNRREAVSYKRVSNALGRIPIDMVKCHPLDNEFWAMSTFELLEKVHQNYQDQRNAGATESLLSVFGLTTAMPGFQLHKMLHEPGAVVPVTNHDDIRFTPRQSSGVQIAQNQMGLERASMDEVTASSEAFRGIAPREKRTATTDSLTNQGAGLRLQDFIDDLEEQFIVPWGEWWGVLMQENAEPETVLRVLNDEEMTQRFFEPEGLLEVVSGAQSSELRALEDKRLLEFIELQGKLKSPFIDERTLLQAWAERLIPEKVDAVVMDDDKMLQREVEKLKMDVQIQIEKLKAEKVLNDARAQIFPPPPMEAPPGPPSSGPPPGPPPLPMGAGSSIDQSLAEPMMDAGMQEMAGEMAGEATL